MHNPKQIPKREPHGKQTRTLHTAKLKNCYTILHLAAMHTLPLTLAICVGMAAAQTCIFLLALQGGAASYAALIEQTQLGWVLRIALALLSITCLYAGFGKGSPAYLAHRLAVRPAIVGFGWACNTAMALLMLWGVEVLVLQGCYLLYAAQADALAFGSHTFLIEAYRDGFLHAMLPMGDWVLWARNLTALAALSLASGYATLQLWRGKQTALGISALLLAVFFFESANSSSVFDILLIVAFGWIALVATLQLLGTGRAVWEEEV